MTQDIISRFYSSLNQPPRIKIPSLTQIIELSVPNKDLQAIFPELVCNIFGGPSFQGGWGLRNISSQERRYEYDLIHNFLHPQGPMFMLCYKLLADPYLTYDLHTKLLPIELQHSFKTGRCEKFYADLLRFDSHLMDSPKLALNPFDYYIFHFALNLLYGSPNKSAQSTDILYFNLVIDYVLHFLPTDPSVAVLPFIPHYQGKMPVVAPMQNVNRTFTTPSLLLKPDLSDLNNQHAQSETRNEVWRSETVLQVFTDIWMSVQNKNYDNYNNLQMFRGYTNTNTCAERVRLCRVVVKQVHQYSSIQSDPVARATALRRYSRQLICKKGYQCVKHLIEVWPLDASFKVVLELWLSLIQPWRYESNSQPVNWQMLDDIQFERGISDSTANYVQFVAENFPTYTCILQMMLHRFLRLDLSAYKNAIMLFRLGKVFAQTQLLSVVKDLEQAVLSNNNGFAHTNNPYDNSYSLSARWGAVAKQAIAELNMNPNLPYEPLWTEQNKSMMIDFIKRIVNAQHTAEKSCEQLQKSIDKKQQGFWAMFFGATSEDYVALGEMKEVPKYLNSALQYFTVIFGINNNVISQESFEEHSIEQSSSYNSSTLQQSITQKLRNRSTSVAYMGDPDLMPITSYENTILVRMLYQISSKINEMYGPQLSRLWNSDNFLGLVSREVLQEPCTIHSYVQDNSHHNSVAEQRLPPRLSLRKLGTHAFIAWMVIGYLVAKLFGFSAITYLFIVFLIWFSIILIKSTAKALGLSKSTD